MRGALSTRNLVLTSVPRTSAPCDTAARLLAHAVGAWQANVAYVPCRALVTCKVPFICPSRRQEPEYFSDECGYDPAACPPNSQRKYIQEVRTPTFTTGPALSLLLTSLPTLFP